MATQQNSKARRLPQARILAFSPHGKAIPVSTEVSLDQAIVNAAFSPGCLGHHTAEEIAIIALGLIKCGSVVLVGGVPVVPEPTTKQKISRLEGRRENAVEEIEGLRREVTNLQCEIDSLRRQTLPQRRRASEGRR